MPKEERRSRGPATERIAHQHHSIPLCSHGVPGKLPKDLIPGGFIFPGQFGKPDQAPPRARSDSLGARKQICPDAVSCRHESAVRRVFAPAEPDGTRIASHFLSPEPKQRTDQDARPLGGHSRQATQPGPPERPEQDGFRLVVAVVRQRNPLRAYDSGRFAEKAVARLPGGVLAPGWLAEACRDQRHTPRPAEPGHPLRIRRAIRAHAVVQVRDSGFKTAAEAKQVQQDCRVAPAGKRHQDPGPIGTESLEVLLKAIRELDRVYLRARPPRTVSSERTPRTPSTSQASSAAYRISS